MKQSIFSISKCISLFIFLLFFASNAAIADPDKNAWKPMPTGINDNGAFNIFLDPHDGNRVWGSPAGTGLWYSDDGGSNWSSVSETEDDLFYARVFGMSFHPGNPDSIVIAAREKLLKTLDRGHSWDRLPASGLPISRIWDMQSHPFNPDIFYVIVLGKGVFKTVNGGNSFIDIADPAFATQMKNAFNIAMNPADPNIIIVSSSSGGVYKSSDAGSTWSAISGGTGSGIIKATARYGTLGFDPVQFGTGPSGFYRLYVSGSSSIGGSRPQFLCYNDTLTQNGWTCPALGGGVPLLSTVGRTFSFSPEGDHSFAVLANERNTYFRLMTFTASTGSITGTVGPVVDRSAHDLLYYKNKDTILIGGLHRVERSIDGGITVENLTKLPEAHNFFIATHPEKKGYIATHRYYSKNNGKKWKYFTGLNPAANTNGFDSFAFSPTRSNVCYGVSHNYETGLEDFFASSDGCKSFNFVSDISSSGNSSQTLVVDPANDQIIYSGHLRKGIYKSTDGGVTWSQKINGFPTANIWAENLIIDPTSPGTLYAALVPFGSSRGIYKTVDSGENWLPITNGIAPGDVTQFWSRIGSVTLDPANSNHLCAIPGGGTNKTSVMYCTNDGGNNWNPVSNSLPAANWFRSLIFDPADSNSMWVTLYNNDTGSQGIYATSDSGTTWGPVNNGIDKSGNLPIIFDIKANNKGSRYFITTFGRGLFSYKPSKILLDPDEDDDDEGHDDDGDSDSDD